MDENTEGRRERIGDTVRPWVKKNPDDFEYDGHTMVGSNAQGDTVLFTVHKHKLLFVGETVGGQIRLQVPNDMERKGKIQDMDHHHQQQK